MGEEERGPPKRLPLKREQKKSLRSKSKVPRGMVILKRLLKTIRQKKSKRDSVPQEISTSVKDDPKAHARSSEKAKGSGNRRRRMERAKPENRTKGLKKGHGRVKKRG